MNKKYTNCLIELLSEEIPARLLKYAEKELLNLFEKECKQNQIKINNYFVLSSPRRLTVIVKNIQSKQEDQILEIKGPSIKSPEIAINGFLKTQKISRKNLIKKITNKGKFYFIEKKIIGKSIGVLLPKIISNIINKFNWPKSQRWGNSDLKWVRPLRNILVLVNDKKIFGEIDLGNGEKIKFKDFTYGHRYFSEKIFIHKTNDYIKLLEKNGVFVDKNDREKIILKEIKSLLNRKKLKLYHDQKLLEEVSGLIEFPNVLLGKINNKFLKLPFDVLSASMKIHQKYFTVVNEQNEIEPYFVFVSNTLKDKKVDKIIIAGNERVLKARLSDALFFWKNDIKKSFDQWLEKLKSVSYYEGLGNMYEKSIRISKISFLIAKQFGYVNLDKAEIVGLYSKVDLVSTMVGEFPELQGVMGGYYSSKNGFDEEFKIALFDQYKPLIQNDNLPRNQLGCILSLSNNIDTVCSFFSIGLKPTGSRDPFALRRSGQSMIKILTKINVPITFRKIVDCYPRKKIKLTEETKENLHDFFTERFRMNMLEEKFSLDIINSVLKKNIVAEKSPYLISQIIKHLEIASRTIKGKSFINNHKRICNIIKDIDVSSLPETIEISLFDTESEKKMHNLLISLEIMNSMLKQEKINSQKIIAEFFNSNHIIENFFKSTMVNADQIKIRLNRLKLLFDLNKIFASVSDFQMIED